MSLFTEVKMWSCISNAAKETLCASQGVATDLDFAHDPKIGTLYLKDEETLSETIDTAIKVCVGGENPYDYAFVGYFLSKESGDAYLAESDYKGEVSIVECNMRFDHIPDPVFPLNVRLSRNEKDGRLCARIVTHPDVVGRKSKGKRFFPDRSWVDAVPGYAKVNVFLEMPKYGFLTGEMLNYTFTDLAKIFEYTRDHFIPRQCISLVKDKAHGEYYVYRSIKNEKTYRFVLSDKDNSVSRVAVYQDEWDELVPNIVWTRSLEELYLREAFTEEQVLGGEDIETTFADKLIGMFTRSDFDPYARSSTNRSLFARWKNSGTKVEGISQCMVEDGIIEMFELDGYGVTIAHLNENNLSKLANYSWSDVQEFFKECSEINKNADESIYAKLKKGKLRLRNSIGVR